MHGLEEASASQLLQPPRIVIMHALTKVAWGRGPLSLRAPGRGRRLPTYTIVDGSSEFH
jgi:hypothetical protein